MQPRARDATLHEILTEPFGPYWDEDVLTDDRTRTTLTRPLILANLQLTCGGRPVG